MSMLYHTPLTSGGFQGKIRNQLKLSQMNRAKQAAAPRSAPQRGAGNVNAKAAQRRSALRFNKFPSNQ